MNVFVRPTLSQTSEYGRQNGRHTPVCLRVSGPSAFFSSHAANAGRHAHPQHPAISCADSTPGSESLDIA